MLPSHQDCENYHENVDDVNGSHPLEWIRWRTTHLENWTPKDVLDWVFHVVDQAHIDGSKFQGEIYRKFSGYDLCHMNLQQFEKADPFFGTTIYDALQFQRKNVSSTRSSNSTQNENFQVLSRIPRNSTEVNNKSLQTTCSDMQTCSVWDINNNNYSMECDTDLVVIQGDNDIEVGIPNLGFYTIDRNIDLTPSSHPSFTPSIIPLAPSPPCFIPSTIPPAPLRIPNLPLFQTLPTPSTSPVAKAHPSAHLPIHNPKSPVCSKVCDLMKTRPTSLVIHSKVRSAPSNLVLSCSPGIEQLPILSPLACPIDQETLSDDSTMDNCFMPPYQGCSTVDSWVNDADDVGINDTMSGRLPASPRKCVDRPSDHRQKKGLAKTRHQLYQFVLELLHDPTANPRLLKWEDKDQGVFKFVQSEAVASLWGKKKNNNNMTYEKMSRAMRFCRKAGYFHEVPKTGRFSKRLVFMFGEKAHGWKN